LINIWFTGNAQLAGAQARIATAVLQSVEIKLQQIGQTVCQEENALNFFDLHLCTQNHYPLCPLFSTLAKISKMRK
jgi:hypothetical protein